LHQQAIKIHIFVTYKILLKTTKQPETYQHNIFTI
jgi:hypothetical protein